MKKNGFSLVELLVVIAILFILATLITGSSQLAKQKAANARCIGNVRQLQVASLLYSIDFNDNLVSNQTGKNLDSWVANWQDFTQSSDNTNVSLIKNAALGTYTQNPQIYKCSISVYKKHVRSYSLNNWTGGDAWYGCDMSKVVSQNAIKKTYEVKSPSTLFTFIEERADSINDGVFIVDMAGHNPRDESLYTIVDFPSFYHGKKAPVAFFDGHAELRKWLDKRTVPIFSGKSLSLNQVQENNEDLAWLQEKSTN